VGAEQDLDADGNVVLPEQQKMLAEAFVAFAHKIIIRAFMARQWDIS